MKTTMIFLSLFFLTAFSFAADPSPAHSPSSAPCPFAVSYVDLVLLFLVGKGYLPQPTRKEAS